MKIIGDLSAIVALAALAVLSWAALLWTVWPVVSAASRLIPSL